METLKIFIASHCDFNCPVHNPAYEILDSRKMDNDRYGELSGSYFSELFNYHWYRENTPVDEMPDYIGFCGYRKYFSFLDNFCPEVIIAAVKKFGCLCGQKLHLQETVRQHYAWNHNIYDLETLTGCALLGHHEEPISKEFNVYFDKFLDGHDMFTCNMFIMHRDDFVKMIDFIWTVLIEFNNWQLSGDTDADVQQHVYNEFMAGHTRCIGGVRHQSRIGGYLGERLVSAYIMWKFPEAKPVGMIMTGDRIR